MTKTEILEDIKAHFPGLNIKLAQIGETPEYLAVECFHGKADSLGQFALRSYKEVQTYFACHIFRKARLSIYFKK